MLVLVGRCERCNGGFPLPLVYDPLTWRTHFDLDGYAQHEREHQANRNRTQGKPEPQPEG